MSFNDYIVYVDESGDYNLNSINPEYPVFVLAFCVFNKVAYIKHITPAIQSFKFKHFGHDEVILHGHKIRKAKDSFAFLHDKSKHLQFMSDLTDLIDSLPFIIVPIAIQKQIFKEKNRLPTHPYHLAMSHGLEEISRFLKNKGAHFGKIHFIFECRGKKEDNELELEFKKACEKNNYRDTLPFEIIFADKRANSCGLQLADLTAYPIARHLLEPTRNNRAYSVIEKKLHPIEKEIMEDWILANPSPKIREFSVV